MFVCPLPKHIWFHTYDITTQARAKVACRRSCSWRVKSCGGRGGGGGGGGPNPPPRHERERLQCRLDEKQKHKHKHRQAQVKEEGKSSFFLCLRLCLRRPGSHVQTGQDRTGQTDRVLGAVIGTYSLEHRQTVSHFLTHRIREKS